MGNNQTYHYLSIKSKILTLAPHSVIFPFYHAVSDQVVPHLKNLYRVQGVKDFEKSIDGLLNCMNPLSVEDAIRNFKKRSYGKPSFHLSFDDGLRETKDIIAPILLKKGIPATFFITAGFTNNKILFHRHKASLIVEKLKTSNSNIVQKRIGSILNISKVDHASLQKVIFSINFQTAHILDEIAEIGIATESLVQYADLVTLPCYEWQHLLVMPEGQRLARAGARNGTSPITLQELAQLQGG